MFCFVFIWNRNEITENKQKKKIREENEKSKLPFYHKKKFDFFLCVDCFSNNDIVSGKCMSAEDLIEKLFQISEIYGPILEKNKKRMYWFILFSKSLVLFLKKRECLRNDSLFFTLTLILTHSHFHSQRRQESLKKQLIIEEQNAEYLKSLQRDKEKEEQRQQAEKIREEKIRRAKSIIKVSLSLSLHVSFSYTPLSPPYPYPYP
jgi:hypothetical protein